jgi:transposase
MPQCPKCGYNVSDSAKGWNYYRFKVELFKCSKCGNQFREYLKEGKLSFVLSAHDGSLGGRPKTKKES